MLNAPLDFLYDFHGGKSSKRFWGNRSATIGSYMLLLLFFTSFIIGMLAGKEVPQQAFDNCYRIGISFLGAGFSLLGFTVAEYIFSKKNDK